MQDFEWQEYKIYGKWLALSPFIPRGAKKKVKFWTITGEVISSAKRSDTYVRGSTSGYNGQVYGNVNSNVVVAHEFWLRKPDGTEEEVQLRGHDIPLREGHKVTMLLAHPEGETNSKYVALINHTAGKYWLLDDGVVDIVEELQETHLSGLLQIVFGSLFLWSVYGFVLFWPLMLILSPLMAVGGENLAGLLLGGAGLYMVFLCLRSIKRNIGAKLKWHECKEKLEPHVRGLAEEILRRGAGAEAPAAEAAPASAVPEPAGA